MGKRTCPVGEKTHFGNFRKVEVSAIRDDTLRFRKERGSFDWKTNVGETVLKPHAEAKCIFKWRG